MLGVNEADTVFSEDDPEPLGKAILAAFAVLESLRRVTGGVIRNEKSELRTMTRYFRFAFHQVNVPLVARD